MSEQETKSNLRLCGCGKLTFSRLFKQIPFPSECDVTDLDGFPCGSKACTLHAEEVCDHCFFAWEQSLLEQK